MTVHPGNATPFSPPKPRTVLMIGSLAWSLVNFRLDLMRRMIANGHRVLAAAPDVDHATEAVLTKAGIEPISVPMNRTGINPVEDLRTLRALRRLIRARRPDLVVPYTMKPIVYGSWAARMENVRCHPLFTGLGYAFSEENPTGKRRAVRSTTILLHRHALSATRLGFYYNAAELHDLRRFRMIPESARMLAVPGSGVDTARFVPSDMPPAPPVVFLFIGRMLRSKGLDDLLEAARQLRAQGCRFRLELVGPTDSNPDAVDEAALRKWQAAGQIRWHGATRDVRPYLATSHVLVLPSRLREGIPRTILEAMASGRPVITTDAPGCGETVGDGEAGFIVPVGDAGALATAMRRFIDDHGLAARMGAEARNRVCRNNDVHLVNRLLLTEMGLEHASHPPPGVISPPVAAARITLPHGTTAIPLPASLSTDVPLAAEGAS
jgi:glycosyltransferase involved in cell wall biosynthesis